MTRRERLLVTAHKAVEEQERAAILRRNVGGWMADDETCPNLMRLAALVEEVGEVARALHDGRPEQVHAELVQVAGVALAWASVYARS